jgi:hypothetical protein
MTKRSTTRRKVQRRLQRSKIRHKGRRQISELRRWPIPSSSQIGPSSFSRISAEGGFEDYCTWNTTVTSLVSSRTHAQSEEEDLVAESVDVEGGSGREEKRRILQYYSAYIPGEARVEGEGEG